MITWEIEKALMEKSVFVNGFTDKPASPDAYLTVLDYNKLDEAFPILPFTTEQWKEACDEWLGNTNCGPACRLAAKTILRKLEKDKIIT